VNNFPFPPAQPDVPNEPGISPNLLNQGNAHGDKPAIQPKRKVGYIYNIIINLAIPFPQSTAIDDLKRDILMQAIGSELALLGAEVLEINIDASAIRLQARIPSHLVIDKIMRAIQNKASLAWLITQREPLFFSGSGIVSTQQISQADIALLMT